MRSAFLQIVCVCVCVCKYGTEVIRTYDACMSVSYVPVCAYVSYVRVRACCCCSAAMLMCMLGLQSYVCMNIHACNTPEHTYVMRSAGYTYIHTYIHAYMHACIHAYMHTCMHACIHIHIHIHTHTHIYNYREREREKERDYEAGIHYEPLVHMHILRTDAFMHAHWVMICTVSSCNTSVCIRFWCPTA